MTAQTLAIATPIALLLPADPIGAVDGRRATVTGGLASPPRGEHPREATFDDAARFYC